MIQENSEEKDYIIINGERFRREEVNISQLVIGELKEKPFLNYKYFLRKYGIPKGKVDSIAHQARRKGIELRPWRKPWTRKQEGNLTKKGEGSRAKNP